MAAQSPPYAQQNAAHSAAVFRQAAFSAFRKGGTVGPADFAITAQGTPNMSVVVAAGRGWMTGTQVANVSGGTWSPQAAYFGINDAPVSLSIAAADPTNPRIDLVVAYALDAFYSGASNLFVLGVITGTPAATPAAPAAPNNAISCATVAVAANATSIVSANIANTAGLMTVARGGILPVSATDVTAGEYDGQYRDFPGKGLQRSLSGAWGYALDDTGWLSVPAFQTGFTVGSDGARYRVKGGICFYQVHAVRASGSTTGLVFTFPTTARPLWNHWELWESAGAPQGEAKVMADGTFSFNSSTGVGIQCVVSGCFPVG